MSSRARRGRSIASLAAVLLAAAGVVVLVVAARSQQSAPQPPASAARPVDVLGTAPRHNPGNPSRAESAASAPIAARRSTSPTGVPVRGPVLPRSKPTRLRIPAIGVSSALQPLGLAVDGTVQVPPLSADSYAGWYRHSPTPGQIGPALILGHIDSARYGPGVFFRLGDLRQRDKVFISRADGSIAVFAVERVVEYSKARFPTLEVYGNTDHAALRLITCGGAFDSSARSYEDNIVAYASLVGVRHVRKGNS